jgi:hypothetical protein
MMANGGERDAKWLADSALLYLSQQKLTRKTPETIQHKLVLPLAMVRVGPIFVRTSHGATPKLRGEATRGGTRASVMSVTERLAASIELRGLTFDKLI